MRIEVTGKRLAASGAAILAIVLALAGTLVRGTGAGPIDASARAQAIVEEKDHVTPGQLARWIIEKRTEYQLIDIRDAWQFDDYHIPTALNIPLAQLFEDTGVKKLSREKKIVLYGLGAEHAAQAQLLLSLKGYKAFSLREGLGGWWDEVMTPTSIRAEDQPAGYLQAKQLREHFAGGPVPSNGADRAAPAVPALPPTPAAPQTKRPSDKLKLGRGCS